MKVETRTNSSRPNATRTALAGILALLLVTCGGEPPRPAEPTPGDQEANPPPGAGPGEGALREDPEAKAQAMFLEASKLQRAGKIRVLRKLVALYPEFSRIAQAHFNLCFYLRKEKRWKEHMEAIDTFAARHPRELGVLELLSWIPKNARPKDAPESYPDARTAYARIRSHVREHLPGPDEAKPEVRSQWYRWGARAAYGLGQPEDACAQLRQARALEHDDANERIKVCYQLALFRAEDADGKQEALDCLGEVQRCLGEPDLVRGGLPSLEDVERFRARLQSRER